MLMDLTWGCQAYFEYLIWMPIIKNYAISGRKSTNTCICFKSSKPWYLYNLSDLPVWNIDIDIDNESRLQYR